jgi:hypothetical protein
MASIMVEGVQTCSTMAQGGRKGNTFTIPVFLLLISFSPFVSYFLFHFLSRFREGSTERVADGARGYRVCKGDYQLGTLWHWWSSGWALSDAVRGQVN